MSAAATQRNAIVSLLPGATELSNFIHYNCLKFENRRIATVRRLLNLFSNFGGFARGEINTRCC